MNSVEQERASASRFHPVEANAPGISSLNALVQRLSFARSLPEIMDVTATAARTLLRADGITFVLREGELCHYAEEDAISPLWKGRRFPMSACISGWCMSERKTAAIPDIYADPRILHEAYRPTFVRSLAMAPVRHEDPIAAMGAYWANKRTIAAAEVELLQDIANAAALAIGYVDLQARQMLNQELHHRVRNMITVVQAVVSRELRGDVERRSNINRKIAALLHADDLLPSAETAPGRLKAILLAELDPYGASHISLSGDDLWLASEQAKALGLIVHELATNAVKHGALSVPEGRIFVQWTVSGHELCLTWREQDGPPPASHRLRGFGMYFVDRVLKTIGGTLCTEWPASGVVHELKFRIAAPYG